MIQSDYLEGFADGRIHGRIEMGVSISALAGFAILAWLLVTA